MFTCLCEKFEHQDYWHVQLNGVISVEQCEWFEDVLPKKLSGAERIMFDFKGITHIDADGVALLLKLFHDLKNQGSLFRCEHVDCHPMLSMLIMRMPQLLGVSIFEKLPPNDHE
jgi:anti-anti-sigma regulatory factor